MSKTMVPRLGDCDVWEKGQLVDGPMDAFFEARQEWSFETFGAPSERGAIGPLKHLQREVYEALIEANEDRLGRGSKEDFLEELADLQFLVYDAVSRAGFTYGEFLDACWRKLAKNRDRRWEARSADGVVEHIREEAND